MAPELLGGGREVMALEGAGRWQGDNGAGGRWAMETCDRYDVARAGQLCARVATPPLPSLPDAVCRVGWCCCC